MRKLIFLACLFIACGLHAQIYTPAGTIPTYGSRDNRRIVETALLFPTGCGVPVKLGMSSVDSLHAAKYFDSCNNKEYTWNPKTKAWRWILDSVTAAVSTAGNADSLGHVAASAYALTSLSNILSNANLLITTGTITAASLTISGRIVIGSLSTTGNGSFGGLTISGNTAASTITGSAITLTGAVTQGGFTSAMAKANSSGQLVSAISGTDYIAPGGYGITTGSTSTVIAAGTKILSIDFYDPALIYVSIGTSVNGWQISPRFTISAGTYSTAVINKYFASGATIYFNGVTASTIIRIYKL